MKSYLQTFALFILTSWSVLANEQALPADIQQLIQQSGFNGAILASKDGQLVYQQYIGYADTNKTVPLKSQHIFSPGSVGKEFTTLGIMMLEQKGLLAYSDKISNYATELPEWAKTVTIHQLLSHTSGLPKISWKSNISTEDVTAQILASKNAFEPGSGYLYSNLNVAMRALIIEKITGMSFSQFLQQYFFKPANMPDSYLQLSQQDISPNLVAGDYTTFINGVTIYVTPLDLFNYEKALSEGVFVPMPVIKTKLEGDTLSGKAHHAMYDFGLFYKDEKGHLTRWKHDGSNPSHHTLKYHDFNKNIIIVIMSSDGNKSTLFKIQDTLLQQLISE